MSRTIFPRLKKVFANKYKIKSTKQSFKASQIDLNFNKNLVIQFKEYEKDKN